jgi:hypothetical protein
MHKIIKGKIFHEMLSTGEANTKKLPRILETFILMAITLKQSQTTISTLLDVLD